MDNAVRGKPRTAAWPWRLKASTRALIGTIGALGLAGYGHAMELTQDSDIKLCWDNTVKYSTVLRLSNPSAAIVGGQPGAEIDEFERTLSASTRVDARMVHGTGQCMDFHHVGRALQIQQLGFALQCAVDHEALAVAAGARVEQVTTASS